MKKIRNSYKKIYNAVRALFSIVGLFVVLFLALFGHAPRLNNLTLSSKGMTSAANIFSPNVAYAASTCPAVAAG